MRLLTCQLYSTLTGRLGLCLLTRLFGRTFSRLLYLNGYLAVNLSVQLFIFFTLLSDDLLNGFLLFLQRCHHILLLGLSTFQRLTLLLALRQQVTLMATHSYQLAVLLVYLRLFCLHSLALHTLIGSILAHETHAAIHLREVVSRKNKHQAVLKCMLTRYEAHRLDVASLTLSQLFLKRFQLRLQDIHIAFNMGNVFLNIVDILLTLAYLGVYHHKVLQAFLHIGLIGTQRLFLLFYLLLNLRALLLKATNRGIAISIFLCRGFFPRSGFLLRSGFLCRRLLARSRGFARLSRSFGFRARAFLLSWHHQHR